jgi:TonB family protein
MVAVTPAMAQDAPVRINPDEANGAVVDKVPPKYPEMAKKMKLTGTVELDAVISPEGKIESVKVLKGNPLLTGSARMALKQWKFKPIQRDGKPIKAACVFAFNFTQ